MTNRKIAKEFLNLTVASASTEASSFAKENVLDRKVWKHWENEYRVLDAQLESMKTTRE